MPRTRSLKWSELKIGIMAVVALLIAAVLIVALGGEGGFFWQRYNLKVKFSNAAGVQVGSPVRVAGVTVGAVTDLEFIGSDVEMLLELREDMQERVTDHVARDHRVGVAAGRRRGRHQRQHDRSADSRMGLRAVGRAAGAAGRRHRAGQQRDRRDHRADARHPRRQGHRRQADDRRAAIRRAASSSPRRPAR